MNMHDWTRAVSGAFPHWHAYFIADIGRALAPELPEGFSVTVEQHLGKLATADLLALHASDPAAAWPPRQVSGRGAVAFAEKEPAVTRRVLLQPQPIRSGKTLTVRHASNDRIVALIEVISPGNKTKDGVRVFVSKTVSAIEAGIHILVVDVLPPGKYDPQGLHGKISRQLTGKGEGPPADTPITFASYRAEWPVPVAYLRHLAPGGPVPDMPLALTPDYYVTVPLGLAYETAFKTIPPNWARAFDEASESA